MILRNPSRIPEDFIFFVKKVEEMDSKTVWKNMICLYSTVGSRENLRLFIEFIFRVKRGVKNGHLSRGKK